MRTLRIEKYGRILIGGELADLSALENKSEFISSIMMLDIELAEDITIGDIIHFFYDSKDIIQTLFSVEYEAVRALTISSVMPSAHKEARLFKSFNIESEMGEGDEFMYMVPEMDITPVEQGEDGLKNISALPLVINENIKLVHKGVTIESKTKLTLLDVMTCLFEELPAIIQEGIILSS